MVLILCTLSDTTSYLYGVWGFIKIPVTVLKVCSQYHCQNVKITIGHNSVIKMYIEF